MTNVRKPQNRDGFRIAIICALTRERDAVIEMLDESWSAAAYKKAVGDTNTYRLGRIGPHNIVVAQLPGIGTEAAASMSASFRSSFPNITLGLVVGVCGGVPTKTASGEILMGDVILSKDIVDFSFGRQFDNKFQIKDTLVDRFGRPNKEIRGFLATMEGKRDRARLRDESLKFLVQLCQTDGFESSQFPGVEKDIVYSRNYRHKHQQPEYCAECAECHAVEDELGEAEVAKKAADEIQRSESKVKQSDVCVRSEKMSCEDLGCDKTKAIVRKTQRRAPQSIEGTTIRVPEIHFGTIGSGNSVMKSGHHRDALAREKKIIAFEMEGVGVWDNFPAVVIKAVCDYADGHKSKDWQDYAAASAAACMKAFLMEWTAVDDASQPVPQAGHVSINQHFLIPRQRVKNFFGREDELSQINSYFEQDTEQPRVVVLHAMGGQGKSQIALEYCQRSYNIYKGMFWVDGSSVLSITQSLVGIARELDESAALALSNDDARVKFALRTLQRWDRRWLMVFDNCDDPETLSNVKHLFPQGNILFTSRHRDLAEVGHIVEVPPMSPQAAVALLLHRYRDINTDDYTSEGAVIVDRLGGLALAIDQASAYMEYIQLPIHKLNTFLSQYLAQREKVLRHTTHNFWKYTKMSDKKEREKAINAFTTWELSFQQLLQNSAKKDNVGHFLTLSAFLGSTVVNESLFWLHWALSKSPPTWTTVFTVPLSETVSKNGIPERPPQQAAAWNGAMTKLLQAVGQIGSDAHKEYWSTDLFWHLLYEAFQMSLLQSISPALESGGASFLLHPLIRDWLQLRLNIEQRQTYAREAVDVLVSTLQVYTDTESNTQFNSTILMHMEAALASDNEFFDEQYRLGCDLSTCNHAYWFAFFYRSQGRFDTSFSLLLKETQTRVRVLGTEHPLAMTSMNNLALVLRDQGIYDQAEQTYRVLVDVSEKMLGREHFKTLISKSNLALVLREQGNYPEAEQMMRVILEAMERLLGKENLDTINSMDNLATVLSDQGNYAEAERMHRVVVKVKERELGRTHPSALLSINNLAVVLSDQSRYSEAEDVQLQAFKASLVTIGLQHPYAQMYRATLLHIWQKQGRKKDEIDNMLRSVTENVNTS